MRKQEDPTPPQISEALNSQHQVWAAVRGVKLETWRGAEGLGFVGFCDGVVLASSELN